LLEYQGRLVDFEQDEHPYRLNDALHQQANLA
jgi:hypothetical protein